MRSAFSYAWKLTVGTGLFALVAVHLDWQEVHLRLTSLSFGTIMAGLVLVLLQAALLGWRWQRIGSLERIELPLASYVQAILVSFFFSQGLPASLGADAFRFWWHVQRGCSAAVALRILTFDRITGVASLAVVCVISLSILASLSDAPALAPLAAVVALCIVSFSILVLPVGARIATGLTRLRERFSGRFARVLDWIIELLRLINSGNRMDIAGILGVGVFVHLLTIGLGYLLAVGLNANVGLLACIAAIGPSLFVSYLPISIAGWGVREASLVVAFGLVGVDAETAILISLGIGLMVLLISLTGGALWALSGSRRLYREGRQRAG